MTSALSGTLARSPRALDAAVIVCGALTGFLTPLILNYLDGLGGFRVAYGSALALGGVPFAALVVILARVAAHVGWLRASVLGVLTMVATLVSITLSADTNAALGAIAEPARELIGGPVGGVIGSGLMALAAMVLRIGPRRAASWLLMVAAGTVLGTLLAPDVWLSSENVWVLFPVWQASIAWILLRTLQNARR